MRIVTIYTVTLFFIYSIIANAQEKTSYMVPGKISAIRQPSTMACWLAVTTMMLSWKDGKNYTIDDVAKTIGDPWKLFYELNTGLPEKDKNSFIKKMGLVGLPPANHMLEKYIDLLKQNGPLWITTGDEWSSHARVLIGVEGKGRYDDTDFIFIDPATGEVQRQPVLNFMKDFEEQAYAANRGKWAEIPIQIYHF